MTGSSVKALEDRLVEPQAPEVRGVEDVLLPLVVGKAPGDARVSSQIAVGRIQH